MNAPGSPDLPDGALALYRAIMGDVRVLLVDLEAGVRAEIASLGTEVHRATDYIEGRRTAETIDRARFDARVQPIRRAVEFVGTHWRTIALIAIALATFLTEVVGRGPT